MSLSSMLCRLTIVPAAVVALASGCSGGTDAAAPPAESDGTISRTVVHLHGDAPPEVVTTRISAEIAAAEVEARAARAASGVDVHANELAPQGITNDTSCAGASLWINDGANQSGNRICFYGSGQADLSSFCHISFRGACLSSWAGAARSYWAGSDPSGYFNHYASPPPSGAPDCEEFFLEYARIDTALPCTQKANYVKLGSDFWAELFGRPVVAPPSNPNPPSIYIDVPNAPGGDAHVTPSSAALTVHVGANDSFLLNAVADNPGGVASIAYDLFDGEIFVNCSSGGLAQHKYYTVAPPSTGASGGPGTAGYTRMSVGWNVDMSTYHCDPGWTATSKGFSVRAHATNYSGVGSGDTAYVQFVYP